MPPGPPPLPGAPGPPVADASPWPGGLPRRLLGSTSGELLSVAMMVVGITLFFRLAQAVFRPGGKVRHPCPQCGLLRHDPDAVHCKACGQVLNIPDQED